MRPQDKSQRFVYDAVHEGCTLCGSDEKTAQANAQEAVDRYCQNRYESLLLMLEEQIDVVVITNGTA